MDLILALYDAAVRLHVYPLVDGVEGNIHTNWLEYRTYKIKELSVCHVPVKLAVSLASDREVPKCLASTALTSGVWAMSSRFHSARNGVWK